MTVERTDGRTDGRTSAVFGSVANGRTVAEQNGRTDAYNGLPLTRRRRTKEGEVEEDLNSRNGASK